MTVFNNFNAHQAGGVLQNAHPVVQVYPWIPNKQTSPTGSTASLVQPQERKSWFVRQGASPGSPLSKPGCGCGGSEGVAMKGIKGKP